MARRRRRGKKKSVTQQIKSINDRYEQKAVEIGDKQERILTQILILIQNRSASYTPQDTNALINSQYRQITKNDASKIVGRVGYTQEYARAIHNRTDWKPRPPNSPGKKGGGYNADAKPRFLKRGFDEEESNIRRIIIEDNKI